MEDNKTYNFNKIQNFKCGENVHQEANLYSFNKQIDFEIINGNLLTYNNILDATCGLEIAAEFFDVAACVISHHANPSAVALANTIENAFDKVLDADTLCVFDSVITFTREINENLAKKLSQMKLKVLIAPSFSSGAIEILKGVKNLKLVKINTPLQEIPTYYQEEIKITPFGALIQQKDTKELDVETFKVATKKKPEQGEVEDMIFASKIAKHAKSSAIVIAKDLRTLAICAGQSNSINALEVAINRVCDSTKNSVVAFDGAIKSIEDIQLIAQNRISGVIQSGGTSKDSEVIALADKLEVSIITTGIKHIKH